MIQTQQNGEKPHFGTNLGHQFFLENLASSVNKLSQSAIIMYNKLPSTK